MANEHSPEFLQEMLAETKKWVPGWLYASLIHAARPRAGGRAAHRIDEPGIFEKLALTEIKPARLREVGDKELDAIWLRIQQWYANAKRRRQAVEDFVNAALWVKTERERRGRKVERTDLVRAVEELESLKKARRDSVRGKKGELPKFIGDRLEKIPEEILLCRDWVSIAGSAAVSEKPGDVDVVVRSSYDTEAGTYGIDGRSLGVALRRFLSPNKRGPQVQLIDAPQGSFTDYIPMFDLVLRRREPHVEKIECTPPEYEERERVIKQARAASAELRAQAERSKKNDELVPGHFFYQPKPTRPAFAEEPQTVERLVKLYTERAEKWLPAWVQKKYDGANHQIHKVGSDVKILSEDGDDNTDRLPGLVAEVAKLPVGNAVLVAELERWEGDKHLPREAVAGYLASKDEPDDSDLVANVYDVLWWGGDLHGKPLQSRLEVLKKLGEGTMGKPNLKKRINVAPGQLAKTPGEIEQAVEKIRKLPGSEGIVAKRMLSPYRLGHVTGDDWVKFHNAVAFIAQVTKANRTKGGVWTYSYAVKPGKDTPATLTPDKLVPVGETFSTGRRLRPGDPIRIEAETINKMIGPQGVALTAWVPRVLGDAEGAVDTVDDVVKRAAKELVLRVKEVDEKGKVKEYLAANVIKALRPEVPTVGPKGARIAFVGASPSKVEVARREPFVGQAGETFNEEYLRPLGLKRSEVVLTNAVPVLLEEDGKTREPTVEEIKEWRGWIHEQLAEKEPEIIVALGRKAESAIADHHNVDFVLPHPSAVRRFGDSGEVKRKLQRIRERLRKSAVSKQLPKPLLRPMAEGGTRAAAAFGHWDKNWNDALPKTGRGEFTYQHHWRGLNEEETKLGEEALLKTDHSLHGDLRLSGNGDELWGFTVFLGKTEDNRGREMGDKLIGWKKDDNIELSPKLAQPREWIDAGARKPLVTGPGEVGATAEKSSKFFKLDGGKYEMGMARQHAVEIFLDGKHLKGRYLILFAPIGGRRRWLIDKPEDQTPWAESRDLADVISELKQKRQRWLYWSKPGDRPQLIDVRSGKVVSKSVSIAKADEVKRIVYGVVLDPYGTGQPDAHNDWTPPEEIEKTAHRYLEQSRVISLQHKKKANAQVVESWVEPYPTGDYKKAMRGEPHRVYKRKFGDDFIHSGSWLLGVKLSEELWEMFKAGKITAFSPGGIGMRRQIRPSAFPEVSFVELVERPTA
jgi:uracil-DNA glycosylase family 4